MMEILKLNNTPVRTSKNYGINNIKLENVEILNSITTFNNVKITTQNSNTLFKKADDIKLVYGVGEPLTTQVKKSCNCNNRIEISDNENISVEYMLDGENSTLIEKFEIIAKENSNSNVVIRYDSTDYIAGYHNGILNVIAEKNANVEVTIVNLLNERSQNFLSIQSELTENSNIRFTIIDFGGKNSVTNYYSNLIGEHSENELNTIYLGTSNQMFDLNYIVELRGEKTNVNIEVQGALKDEAKKQFKGTIDFKKGSKKAKGNENEYCMLLSNRAKSKALPMLLCSEEEVEGNHSSSAGKISEKELFYIMSRGFELKEAMKMMVRARFNNIIKNIKDERLINEILYEIDKRLD